MTLPSALAPLETITLVQDRRLWGAKGVVRKPNDNKIDKNRELIIIKLGC